MCGILGKVNKNTSISKDSFEFALTTLAKRGPDAGGTLIDGNVALGHRRLSIIDLSTQGNQPMSNEDSTIEIVFNGEIYNYKDVKKILKKNHKWKSQSDTETSIHLYEEVGADVVNYIEGMFTFALYDKLKKTIFIAKDHFGKKPLYYYLDNETFVFASEIKAILSFPDIKRKLTIDTNSLNKFLIYGYIPSPHTIFNEIKKLQPSSCTTFDINKWKLSAPRDYWKLESIQVSHKKQSEIDVLDNIEGLLNEAVKKRLMSDVPLGVFLSGGVDSSLISYYMSKHTEHITAFSVCYDEDSSINERIYAEEVSKLLNINTSFHNFTLSDIKENFIGMLDYIDEPLADAAIIPLHFISKIAKSKITVALGGDGGDEVFGGYPRYQAQMFIENHRYLSVLAFFAKKIIPKDNMYYKLFSSFNLNFAQRQYIFGTGGFTPEEVYNLIGNKNIDLDTISQDISSCEKLYSTDDHVNKSLYLDCKLQLPDWYLVKSDRATMANSLEMRSPLLDKKLAEYAFSLPGGMKIKSGTNKYLLKKLASKYFSNDLVYRKKKGFGVPMRSWIKNELKDVFESYLYLNHGYFDNSFVETLYKDHISGKYNNEFKLLRILCFNYWYKHYYD